jgi:hypothetical protein
MKNAPSFLKKLHFDFLHQSQQEKFIEDISEESIFGICGRRYMIAKTMFLPFAF